jgi:hypothetical protein
MPSPVQIRQRDRRGDASGVVACSGRKGAVSMSQQHGHGAVGSDRNIGPPVAVQVPYGHGEGKV